MSLDRVGKIAEGDQRVKKMVTVGAATDDVQPEIDLGGSAFDGSFHALLLVGGLFVDGRLVVRGVEAVGELVLDHRQAILVGILTERRSEERRVGKECRSRWS